MKSIMQEASSIAKAVEQAWVTAGKPQEFSVKVFEESQKNFFGMTVKSAKIALFFDQKGVREKPQETTMRKRPSAVLEQKKTIGKKQYQEPAPTVLHEQPVPEPKERVVEKPSYKQTAQREIWTVPMIECAQQWVRQTLDTMQKSDVSFTTKQNNYYLRFSFDKPVATTPERERQLFRSFSFLLLQTLKKEFKRSLHGFKIVLVREV